MRVTFLTHYPQLYGANRSLLDLIEGLKPYGVDASVLVSGGGPMVEELARNKIPFHVLRLGRWSSRRPEGYGRYPVLKRGLWRCRRGAGQMKANVRALPAVLRQLRTWRTELVYSNSSLLLTGAVAARLLDLPHVWHLREFGELDYGFAPDLGRTAQKWIINRADGIVAISEAIRGHYRLGAMSDIRVVQSGIFRETDMNRLRDVATCRQRPSTYTFALVGLLHPAKGQEAAVRALHEVIGTGRDARLRLVGSGRSDYRRHLEQLVERLGLASRVSFLGYVEDVYATYLDADAVLMCSRHEGMGRVTAEAMAACRPIIGFRGAGTSEIIQDNVTGLFYDDEATSLAAAMIRFLDRPEWARTLGLNGSRRASELFTIERSAAGVFDILSGCVRSGTPRLGAPTGARPRSADPRPMPAGVFAAPSYRDSVEPAE